MKAFKALLAAAFLMAVAVGCSTTKDKENMLSAAGFKMVPADTSQQLAHLNSLPTGKITPVQRSGKMYYSFPDKSKNVLYVGQEPQYQKYRELCLQKQITEEQLSAAQLNNEGEWGVWGAWGGGWVVR
jgi:hypothetical protein